MRRGHFCDACGLRAAGTDPRHQHFLPGFGSAINQLAIASGRQIIVADDLVKGRKAPGIRGRYSTEAALDALLAGSGLRFVVVGDTLVVRRSDAPDQDTQLADITVTGTRIRGRGPVGSAVVTIDRKAIDGSGFSTVQQLMQAIPQNFGGGASDGALGGTLDPNSSVNTSYGSSVNLRGLGSASTLVLLNGDRPALGGGSGLFADVSMIPVAAIERIEVVPDGASAVYGSDAVAGVVNIIPRITFTGAETSFRIGSADGSFEEYDASLLLGTRWSSGRAMIAYEFYDRGAFAAADSPFATDNLSAFGGPDRRTNYSNPGTITAGGKTFAIPRGQNGTGLTAAQLTAGTVNKGDSWYGADIQPMQRRHSVFAALSQNLLPNLRFYAQALGTIRTFDGYVRPSIDASRTVPVTDPYYVDPVGTHQPIRVQYSFVKDLGPEGRRGLVSAFSGTAGFVWDIGRWNVDARGSRGRQYERTTNYNRVNTARLAVALADTNPATAYNLLGDGSFTNPATINSIRGSLTTSDRGIVWSTSLRANGPLITLPAGDVSAAIGAEYRVENYIFYPNIADISTLTPTTTVPVPLPSPRTVRAAYGELVVPIFGAANGFAGMRRVELSAAVRTERYSDFGTTTNPRFGFTWAPSNSITFRGSYGRSFRAPTFNQLRQDPSAKLVFTYTVADPQSSSGTSNIVVIRGNDPDLKPERANTLTLGFDVRPVEVPSLHIGVTWFKVDYRDRIADPSSYLTTFLTNRATFLPIIEENPSASRVAALYADPYFSNFVNVDASTIKAVVDARLQNLSVVKISGLDMDAGYAFDLAGGRADLGIDATYTFHIDQQLSASGPVTDVVGILGNPVDIRGRAHVGWSSDRWGAVLSANYVDGYQNKLLGTAQPVAAWTTFDLQLSYTVPKSGSALGGLRIALTATNLFDRDPPYAAYAVGTTTYGWDPENANPVGRMVSLQVTKKW